MYSPLYSIWIGKDGVKLAEMTDLPSRMVLHHTKIAMSRPDADAIVVSDPQLPISLLSREKGSTEWVAHRANDWEMGLDPNLLKRYLK